MRITFLKESNMKKFTFTLEVVSDHEFDTASLADGFLAQAVSAVSNYNEAVCAIKPVIVKELKEQGFKVWRARVTGVTAKAAGDAHNSKVEEEAVA